MIANERSVPAEMPEDVHILVPVSMFTSYTQRAVGCQLTFGPCGITNDFKAYLFDVAFRPSNRPVLARSALPVQIVIMLPLSNPFILIQSSRGLLLTSFLVPCPPGIQRRSNAGHVIKL